MSQNVCKPWAFQSLNKPKMFHMALYENPSLAFGPFIDRTGPRSLDLYHVWPRFRPGAILCTGYIHTHNKDSPSKVGWPCSHACSWWFFFGWMIFLTDSRFYHAMGFITIWESIFLVHFFQPPKKQIEVSTGWRGRIFGFGGGLARSEYIHWHIDWFELFVLFSHYWFEVVELHGGL